MKRFIELLAIGGAGFVGAVARYLVALICNSIFGAAFPIGTMVINLTGCFILGWFITLISQRVTVSDAFRLAVAVGFVGSYTTFSTYIFESNALLEAGEKWTSILNLLGSIVLGLIAVRLGIAMASRA